MTEIENHKLQYTTIQISAQLFSGFQYKIPTDLLKNMSNDEVIKETKIYMKNFFDTHNLWILKDKVDELEFHIHDDLEKLDETKILYLCDHCHD